ncbi:MAG: hypothetical protein ABSF22_00410 [Bryobacteraceae bacterium]|jgi:hypothetical protein
MTQPVWNFEQEPWKPEHGVHDETAINLRAYFDRMADHKMLEYDPSWTAEQIIEWDGNFTTDGNLLLGCSERDVEVEEYRRVMAQAIAYRERVRQASLL